METSKELVTSMTSGMTTWINEKYMKKWPQVKFLGKRLFRAHYRSRTHDLSDTGWNALATEVICWVLMCDRCTANDK